MKNLLKKLLNSNSDSLMELEHLFQKKYPEETGIQNLLRSYIYSESSESVTDSELAEILQSFIERKV